MLLRERKLNIPEEVRVQTRRLATSLRWHHGTSDGTLITRRKGLAGVLAGAVIAAVGLPATSASAATVFTAGTLVLPEGIIPAPGSGYLVSDADNDAIYLVPATGGAPTAQQPTGFRTFGEVQLPAGYSNSGTFLAYGTNATSTNGVAALVGTSGIAAPTPVINATNAWYTTAVVAPASYGSIASGSVVLGNNPGGVGAPTSTIEVLNSNLSGTTTFTTLTGVDAFGVGFAPAESARLFQKFSRLRSGASGYYGTGLGLYIVRRLMELADGRVSAQSDGPGKGASVRLIWPAALMSAAAPPQPAAGQETRP